MNVDYSQSVISFALLLYANVEAVIACANKSTQYWQWSPSHDASQTTHIVDVTLFIDAGLRY